ncbi:MAG: hypothetical protein HYV40_00150 [Candidatus Levybacteria bacterium]|nr:hypothetical protein [Candidatus Levybacteria bacterium]
MQQKILDYYLQCGMFTYPGLYEDYLKTLPDDVKELGELLRKNFLHRTTLEAGNVGTNIDLKYGDMRKIPWWRQAEDDNLVTTAAMLAEFFRRDGRGITVERKAEDKLVLTCRNVAILMASILKAKGVPARVRSGFAAYFEGTNDAWDHWINQYRDRSKNRWITIDVDGSWHRTRFDMYDMPEGKFDFSADVWLDVRHGKRDGKHFRNAGGFDGLVCIAWELFYDFHCLMNSEIIYLHHPVPVMLNNFKNLSKEKLKEIDHLAELMKNLDENFDELKKIWETNKEFRILSGALL